MSNGFLAPRYSSEQKAAVVALIVERGFSPREAVERARSGVSGLPPFAMNVDTARLEASRELKRRDEDRRVDLAALEPQRLVRESVSSAVRICNAELVKLESAAEVDLDALGRLVKALQVVQRMTMDVPREQWDERPAEAHPLAGLVSLGEVRVPVKRKAVRRRAA